MISVEDIVDEKIRYRCDGLISNKVSSLLITRKVRKGVEEEVLDTLWKGITIEVVYQLKEDIIKRVNKDSPILI